MVVDIYDEYGGLIEKPAFEVELLPNDGRDEEAEELVMDWTYTGWTDEGYLEL